LLPLLHVACYYLYYYIPACFGRTTIKQKIYINR
jgi:hypothetical protein